MSPTPTTVSLYYFVKNGSFEQSSNNQNGLPNQWRWNQPTLDIGEGRVCNASTDGKCSFKFTPIKGDTTSNPPLVKTLFQDFNVKGGMGSKYSLTLSARANNLGTTGSFNAKINFFDSLGKLVSTKTISFPSGTYTFKNYGVEGVTDRAFTRVRVQSSFSKTTGSAWIDNVSGGLIINK